MRKENNLLIIFNLFTDMKETFIWELKDLN